MAKFEPWLNHYVFLKCIYILSFYIAMYVYAEDFSMAIMPGSQIRSLLINHAFDTLQLSLISAPMYVNRILQIV